MALISVLLLSTCAPGRFTGSSRVISDRCFTGIFSDGAISLEVIERDGYITASGRKVSSMSAVPPWEFIDMRGDVVEVGSAQAQVTVHLPPQGGQFPVIPVPGVILKIPLDPVDMCSMRTPLTFSLGYDWAGTRYDESYTLGRMP